MLPALAQTVSVDSAYVITLPDDMKAAEVTGDEKADGLMADMKNDALQAVVYEYDPDPSYSYTIDDMYQGLPRRPAGRPLRQRRHRGDQRRKA